MVTSAVAQEAKPSIVKPIWPAKPPGDTVELPPEQDVTKPDAKDAGGKRIIRLTNVSIPTISIYRPSKETDTGTSVIICPGGGHSILAFNHEGTETAEWLTTLGVTGIVLKYRVPTRTPNGDRWKAAVQDAQRAVSLVRSRASEWGIHPQRIGIVGFSAGGHLAIATATSFHQRTYEPIDDIDKISCRPDFAIPVYPGYLKPKDKDELAPYINIPADAPPMFLVHGGEDIISPPEHSVLMYLALRRAGVPAELHVYAGTAHDFGVRKSDRACSTWTQSCADWLRAQSFLPSDLH